MEQFESHHSNKVPKLGEHLPKFHPLPIENLLVNKFSSHDFHALSYHKKTEIIFSELLEYIKDSKTHGFLFPSIVLLFHRLVEEKIISHLQFSYFEFWLNQFSGLSFEENYKIRSKIVGKYVPRDLYQIYFPVGQNKVYSGSHFVTAHSSPDLDTTVASFWGWLDAFGAKVSDGLHHWNVPGGAPDFSVEYKMIFENVFSKHLVSCCAKTYSTLQITSFEILTQKGMVRRLTDASSLSLDIEKNQQAVVLVNEDGYFQGDWRTQDIEGVRQVVMLVNQMLRHFENTFQQGLIALFAKPDLKKSDMEPFIKGMLSKKLYEAEPLNDLTERQRKVVTDYLVHILHVEEGLNADMTQMAHGFVKNNITRFEQFIALIKTKLFGELFDGSGELVATRAKLFETLDQIITSLDDAIHASRKFVDRLSVSLEIKSKVFGYKPLSVSDKSDVEELRTLMGNNSYLSVNIHENNHLFPIGVVYASDLYKPTLGTVSLRDFSNREETKVPGYLEVISVVDHHKSQLSGTIPATMRISDAQSANVILAQMAFEMNDRYSTLGMSREQIEAQLKKLDGKLNSTGARRIYAKLLKKMENVEKRGHFFIDPKREYTEYMHFLFAMLDDTDLLSKVTRVDVEVVKELINRMKTLLMQEEVESIVFDDISENEEFTQVAAQRLLRSSDLHSITQNIFKQKESFINDVLKHAAERKDTPFFADTKEQNGCARVGQFKLFGTNFATFKNLEASLKEIFVEQSRKAYERKPEVDLHIFMISTVSGIDPLEQKNHNHQDELWFYAASETGLAHLRTFLQNFSITPLAKKVVQEIEVAGEWKEAAHELAESTLGDKLGIKAKMSFDKKPAPTIVLKVAPGSVNSRKSAISPFLPKLAI